jgi:hypothetical protein
MRDIINGIQNVFKVYREADAITQNNYDLRISFVVVICEFFVVYAVYKYFTT